MAGVKRDTVKSIADSQAELFKVVQNGIKRDSPFKDLVSIGTMERGAAAEQLARTTLDAPDPPDKE